MLQLACLFQSLYELFLQSKLLFMFDANFKHSAAYMLVEKEQVVYLSFENVIHKTQA